ncbi:MAG TPA: cytochrome c [Terriglobales bacterium]
MNKVIGLAILAVVLVLAGAGAFMFSGIYDVGADTPHWALTTKAMEIVRDRAIAVRAKDIQVPDLTGEQLILKGAGQYAAMCVNCHLAPGKPDSEIRAGLYPKPPNLSESTFDPRTVFWVMKHGLKMSGMPAWGAGHDDETLWSIVAFVGKLPRMSAQQYQDIVAKAPPDEEMESMEKAGGHNHAQGGGPDEPRSEPAKQTGPKSESLH